MNIIQEVSNQCYRNVMKRKAKYVRYGKHWNYVYISCGVDLLGSTIATYKANYKDIAKNGLKMRAHYLK